MKAEEKRRVALFSTNFLEFSQTFIYEEIKHHERYEIDVFCHRRLNEERFPYPKVHSLTPAGNIRDEVAALVYQMTTLNPGYLREIREGGYSLIHAQFGPGSIYALTYAQAARLPLIVTFGGYDVPLLQTKRRFYPQYWRYWWRSRAMLRCADRFLPVSFDLAERLIALGAPPERVEVFHRGIHVPEEVHRTAKEPGAPMEVLMVGRFVEKKGFEFGLRAFSRFVRERRAEARLSIVGTGPLKSRLERAARDLGMTGRIIFLGELTHAEVFEIMLRADVLLLPCVVAANGDTEGITNVLKEANARAVPAIITRHGGNPEIVEDGETGFIVEERDVIAMAARLGELFDHPERRVEMGRRARAKMKSELDFKRTGEVLERHYDEVLGYTEGSL